MPFRRRWLALAGCVWLLAVAVPSALAIHEYTDVPDASPFHEDISALRTAGITTGKTCEPPGTAPTYCPEEGIKRQAMAAFMNRGFGRITGENGPDLGPGPQVLAEIDVEVGGLPGQTQFVKLDGSVVQCDCVNSTPLPPPCPCVTTFFIAQAGHGRISQQMHQTTYDHLSFHDTGSVTAVVPVPAGTTQNFTLVLLPFEGAQVFSVRGALTAVVAPFGSTGGNTLSTSARLPTTGRPRL